MFKEKIELLAPAGKWEVMESVAKAGADAVYCGGKKHNMRMLRTDFNFSDQELAEAVDYLHRLNKKLYVTVNNLYYEDEIKQIKEHLLFLQGIKVDALIIQDIALVQLHRELQLELPLHASVQMGISSSQAAQYLEDLGFSRVVLSKNTSLAEIEQIHQNTKNIIIEYFAHGDLCISHTGQCYMSSFIAAEGGNRGRCIKPCRWPYTLQGGEEKIQDKRYFLAHNDLCAYPHLLEMVKAGVRSFKIEGRMRDADYLSFLVKVYRQALDKIIKQPELYHTDKSQLEGLESRRIRDYTSGNLLGRPDSVAIGLTGDREPFFPTEPRLIKKLDTRDYHDFTLDKPAAMQISVKIGGADSLAAVQGSGINHVIIGCENIRQIKKGWNKEEINAALLAAKENGVSIVLETPRIVCGEDMASLRRYLGEMDYNLLKGVIVNDYGSLKLAGEMGLTPWAGQGLNIVNSRGAHLLISGGIYRVLLSQEVNLKNINPLLHKHFNLEMTVHGPLCGMITDYCISRGVVEQSDSVDCLGYCVQDEYALMDGRGQKYDIRTDSNCRNYIFYPYDLCLFPYLPLLAQAGLKSIRIEGQYYNSEVLKEVVNIYLQAVNNIKKAKWEQKNNYFRLLELFPRGLSERLFTGESKKENSIRSANG